MNPVVPLAAQPTSPLKSPEARQAMQFAGQERNFEMGADLQRQLWMRAAAEDPDFAHDVPLARKPFTQKGAYGGRWACLQV